uniref:Uncharacterized protein n=1 Tax=Anguilla anguilla TaxID=7936 RepID=A0A0E9VQV4_ANGAN
MYCFAPLNAYRNYYIVSVSNNFGDLTVYVKYLKHKILQNSNIKK